MVVLIDLVEGNWISSCSWRSFASSHNFCLTPRIWGCIYTGTVWSVLNEPWLPSTDSIVHLEWCECSLTLIWCWTLILLKTGGSRCIRKWTLLQFAYNVNSWYSADAIELLWSTEALFTWRFRRKRCLDVRQHKYGFYGSRKRNNSKSGPRV